MGSITYHYYLPVSRVSGQHGRLALRHVSAGVLRQPRGRLLQGEEAQCGSTYCYLSALLQPCECNMYGSQSAECDPRTGQCLCKEKYVGRTCGQCKGSSRSLLNCIYYIYVCDMLDGFGAIRAGCRQCGCNRVGSVGDLCDGDTGQCDCRWGIALV